MLWVIFVAFPLGVAVAMALAPRTPRWVWAFVIAGVIAIECALLGKPSTTWELRHVLAAWLLAIIFPWASVALYVWLMPYPARPVLTAVWLPFVYNLALVIGLVFGDISEFISQ